MSIILCRVCWMDNYNGTGKLQCVHMTWNEDYGGEMWNFNPCEDGMIRGYVMLKAKDKDGNYPGTININTLGASKKDQYIDGVNVIFFAMNPEDKTNYIVGWYENARVYRNWRTYQVKSNKSGEERTYSFEVDKSNAFLIIEKERSIKIVSAQSKEAKLRGGKFPGRSDVFFADSNEAYSYELNEQLKLHKIKQDFSKIETSNNITETEKKRLISSRIGQGWYRDQLISYWGGCSVTKCDETSVLRASHIKPWRVSNNNERLNVYNGLLLTPNLDILFDKGFISFDDNGKIIISKCISNANINKLGIDSKMKIELCELHLAFLQWHRDNVFKS